MNPQEFRERCKGVFVLLPTPFKENYDLDFEGLRRNVHFLVENKVDALIPLGSTGEFSSLSVGERKRVVETVVDEANGKVLVMPGTAHSSTKVAIELSKHAEDAGADGVMIVPPYYFKVSDEGLYNHYKMIADSINIGIMLYNNPRTTKICMSLELLEKLFQVENVVAIKDVSRIPGYFAEVIRRFGDSFAVLGTGENAYTVWGCLLGIKGVISLSANIAPEHSIEFYEAGITEKDFEKSLKLAKKLDPLDRLWTPTMRYIEYYKAAMILLGIPAGPVRPPLTSLNKKEIQETRKALIKIGLLKSEECTPM